MRVSTDTNIVSSAIDTNYFKAMRPAEKYIKYILSGDCPNIDFALPVVVFDLIAFRGMD
jgi:hypothetical protein